MRKFIVSTFITILVVGLGINVQAQECGPGCPICSGSGSSTGALLAPGTMVSTAMAIPNGEDDTGIFNLRAGVTSWLDLGLGYGIKSEQLIWSVRIQPFAEDESSWKPGIILGTGSVRTGGSDQSVFLQITKAFDFNEIISARFSVGFASLLPNLNQEFLLASLTMTVYEHWSPFLSYDGRNFHYGLSWIPLDWLFIAGFMVEAKTPAFLVGYRWSF